MNREAEMRDEGEKEKEVYLDRKNRKMCKMNNN